MSSAIVLSTAGPRWRLAKYWGTNHREDLSERAALSVDTLRKAGFVAKITETRATIDNECMRINVEIFGTEETLDAARHHLRGFWAALESRGLPQAYQQGFATGAAFLVSLGQPKRQKLPPLNSSRRLKA